ncbi:MAG: carboxypeptidase-like regulatory domain-containing protein [Acidobacteriota bacterium]|nr:carboxypeptidase-like regulatory domain-containing protein [Acidobacteriota bacterium]
MEQGTLTGTITDPSGAAISNVRIAATNQETRDASETKTNADGYYRLPFLPPGEYEILAEKQGFNASRVSGIHLTVGLTATINATLVVGSLQQEVTVSATAVQLEQESSSLGTVVGSKQIIELPLLGRDPYALVLLAPACFRKAVAGRGRLSTAAARTPAKSFWTARKRATAPPTTFPIARRSKPFRNSKSSPIISQASLGGRAGAFSP